MKFVIFFFFFFFSIVSNSQSLIQGQLIDVGEKPVEYIEVVLYSKEKIGIKSTFTDENGLFSLKHDKGEYIIQFRHLGNILYEKDIKLNDNINLGLIKVDLTNSLNEIVLTNDKKIIEKKIDRIVFNVENSIASTGMDLAQVFQNTPLINISENEIGIIGKSNVLILINDKLLQLSGSELINYFRSLRSEDVKKIEIITTPPAKYEAQGSSGIINIILKKNEAKGISGNATTWATKTTYSGIGNNLTLNYNNKRIVSSVRLRQNDTQAEAIEKININGETSLFSDDKRKDIFRNKGVNTSIDVELSKKTNIGLIYDYGKSDNRMKIRNINTYLTGNSIDSILKTNSYHVNNKEIHTLNLYLDHKIDSLGKKFSIVYNLFDNRPTNDVLFNTNSEINNYSVETNSLIDYKINSVQIDFTLPFSKFNMEFGAKYTILNNNSDVKYFNIINETNTIDISKSNIFNYEERISSGYISADKKFNDKWSSKFGLRYEHSYVNPNNLTINEETTTRYDNIFPSFYLQYNHNDDKTYSVSYSKRINRPNFNALNPFRWYSNPYAYSTGNPSLSPSISHNLETSFVYKSNLNLSVYADKIDNEYGRIVYFEDGIKIVDNLNYLTLYNFGIYGNLNNYPKDWWENSISFSFYYSTSESDVESIKPQSGSTFYYAINNSFFLNKKKTTVLFLNFWHSLPSTEGNIFIRDLSSLASGVRFSLLDNNLKIGASISDIFKTMVSKGEVYFADYTNTFNNYYDNRRLNVSVNYTFGNKKIKPNNIDIPFSEQNRAN